MSSPKLIPIHNPRKIPPHTPSYKLLYFHTKRSSFHTPNLPPILLSHSGYLYSPHPDSVPQMGYNRPSSHPQRSHCTRIPGWIPLLGPVPDVSPRYSHASIRAQGLRSDSYPPNTHISLSSYQCSQNPGSVI